MEITFEQEVFRPYSVWSVLVDGKVRGIIKEELTEYKFSLNMGGIVGGEPSLQLAKEKVTQILQDGN